MIRLIILTIFLLISLYSCGDTTTEQSKPTQKYNVNLSGFRSFDSLTGFITVENDTQSIVVYYDSLNTKKIYPISFNANDQDSAIIQLLLWNNGFPNSLLTDKLLESISKANLRAKSLGYFDILLENYTINHSENLGAFASCFHNYDHEIIKAGWDFNNDNKLDDTLKNLKHETEFSINNCDTETQDTSFYSFNEFKTNTSKTVFFSYEFYNGIQVKIPVSITKRKLLFDTRDGNYYDYRTFDSLDWMMEDLRYFDQKYWPEMKRQEYSISYTNKMLDSIKLCPEAWRLPTKKEWLQVFKDLRPELDSTQSLRSDWYSFPEFWHFQNRNPDIMIYASNSSYIDNSVVLVSRAELYEEPIGTSTSYWNKNPYHFVRCVREVN